MARPDTVTMPMYTHANQARPGRCALIELKGNAAPLIALGFAASFRYPVVQCAVLRGNLT